MTYWIKMYSIRFEESNSLIRIERDEITPLEIADTYIKDILETVNLARGHLASIHVLLVLPANGVQVAETAERLKVMSAMFAASESEKIAVVTPSALMAMQLRRVAGTHRLVVFVTEDAARNWLRAPLE